MTQRPVALITGAAAGIGAETARQFGAANYQVHICDIAADAVEDFVARHPGTAGTITDVGDAAAVDHLFDELVSSWGRLDVLVNNAGIAGPTAAVEDVLPEDWQRTVAVYLNGAFYCTRRAVPLLRQSTAGSILNIASNAAFFGFPYRTPYTACKWALIGLTKTLAMELGPAGIRVNAICPGSVGGARIDGVIERDARERGLAPAEIRQVYERQSSLRVFVDAADVAALAVFLASDAGRFISGQAIGVDGHTESLSNWLDD
jgi:NAD(P)-dependent dehydrogenase (short-subunit alcohol dehydrogenase family)